LTKRNHRAILLKADETYAYEKCAAPDEPAEMEKIMRQKKISYWLKGIDVLLGAMGLIFFGGLTFFALQLKELDAQSLFWTFIFSSWYIAVLCYGVLIEFWKVCTQIGRDNSFSVENAKSFHRMGMCGALSAVGFAVRIVYLAIGGALGLPVAVFTVAEILIALVFVVLCEALSRLIINAYEMKQENDLTI
jgi:hypothetical protein